MPSLTDVSDRHTIIDRREGEYLCFPDVVRTDDGRLIVAYNEADRHIQPTRRVLLTKMSFDEGRTWSDFKRMDVARSHCPRLVKLKDGTILLCDSSQVFHRSRDNGDTWETMQIKGFVHDMIDRVIDLGNDVFLATGHVHRGTYAHPAIQQPPAEQMLYRSEDGCRTWKPISVIARERNLVLCEASIVRLDDGRTLSLMRENSYVHEPMYLCISHDDGCTWSDPVPTPLIGHRPTMGIIDDGRLLVTYRNVGPDMGTCAWVGTLEELIDDYRVQGRHEIPGSATLTPDGLRMINNASGSVARYVLRPMTDPRSAMAILEAEVRVDSADKDGCAMRLGTWWHIYPDRIVPDTASDTSIAIEPGRFNTIRLEYEQGRVTLSVNGQKRCALGLNNDHCDSRPIVFGAPYANEDTVTDCTWKRLRLVTNEPRLQRQYTWNWRAEDGLPDQWALDNILELMNDREAEALDFGYSGWTTLEDGSFYCVYHNGGGTDAGYTPQYTAYIMGTRFSLDDFEREPSDR